MESSLMVQSNKPFPIDARELHGKLGVGRDFSTWIKDRIERFSFVELVDYQTISRSPIPGSGNRGSSTEYFFAIPAAKMIAAIENTEQGRAVLANLVKIETAWNTPEMALVRGLQAAQELIERKNREINELSGDAAAARVIACAEGLKTISEVGKINGIGPRKIFEVLHDSGILYRSGRSWVPYQRFIEAGYFVVKESTYEINGIDQLYSKTYVTGKGEVWMAKQLFGVAEATA